MVFRQNRIISLTDVGVLQQTINARTEGRCRVQSVIRLHVSDFIVIHDDIHGVIQLLNALLNATKLIIS